MTKTRSKLTLLRTVYPPISNHEATFLQNDPEVEALLRQSDFYIIAGRALSEMRDFHFDAEEATLKFDFVVGFGPAHPDIVHLLELPGVAATDGNVEIETWERGRGFRIWHGDGDERQVVEWFTTEKLLWERARNRPGIIGLENVRDLATYDLLYVGIATKGDSFSRLLKRGHKARQEILSKEPQRYPGARVSDEIFLFMLTCEPLIITHFEPDHSFTETDLDGSYEAKRITADAEKAFVSLLKPEYNIQLFPNYPKGSDGLYESGYARYGYVIAEQMAFNTAHGTFRGSFDGGTGMITNDGDAIFIEGDEVKFFRSGIDFPSETGKAIA
jgi:hypothetical protein